MPSDPTIVLIHGFWVTPRSWEHWISRYESQGHTVLAPAYPGLEVEVEAINADPSPLEALTIDKIVAHLESVIEPLEQPPILIGHSAGGCFTQLLLDRGHGAAGVVIDSAPTEGVRVVPPSQLKAAFSILAHPSTRHKAVPLTPEQWHYAFATTCSEEESRALYDRYHVPASGAIFWESVLANVQPGPQGTHVDYHNDERAPLLFITGGKDNLMPPSIQHSNAKHYKSDTVTEVKDFEERDHATIATPGWEEVADYALSWAKEHAAAPAA